MPSWNKLFLRNENIKLFPQTEIYRFIKKLENTFSSLPLRIWDHCCGAGRHSILITQMGHQAFSSDISENGIEYLKQWLQNEKLNGEVKLSNMCLNPWHDSFFHGVISWDAIYHNKIAEIEKAIESIRRSLVKGGLFIDTLM